MPYDPNDPNWSVNWPILIEMVISGVAAWWIASTARHWLFY